MKHIIKSNKLGINKFITKRSYCNKLGTPFEKSKLYNFMINSVCWGIASGIVVGGIAVGDIAYGDYITDKENTSLGMFIFAPICGMVVGGVGGGLVGLTWPLLAVSGGFALIGAGTNTVRNGGFNYSIKIKKKKEYKKY
jgi:hypothetical protein